MGLLLLAAVLALAVLTGDASGQDEVGDGCTPNCVILIQVDGLEPKDVTPATTPYLYALAHPTVQGQGSPEGALNGRSGWIWQAPRGVMSTSTAAATASLLTGAYPERSGVPSDEFLERTPGGLAKWQRLGAGGFGDARPRATANDEHVSPDGAEPIATGGLEVETIMAALRNDGADVGVFLGDPALAGIGDAVSPDGVYWFPPGDEDSATSVSGQYTGDSRLCPIPRYPDVAPSEETHDPRTCPANDLTTMNKAAEDLTLEEAERVGFTFIHLAELGVAKRRAADPDNEADPNTELVPQPPHPARALAETDAAVQAFAERYAQAKPDKWRKTVVMVVGTHGYQTTPLVKRVPDPRVLDPDPDNLETPGADALPTRDLSDYVGSLGDVTLAPQGTAATVYYTGPSGTRKAKLEVVKARLLGEVNDACSERLGGKCIREVLYVNPADEPTPEERIDHPEKHPTWRLDVRDENGVRTGTSGDLLVVLEPGWATGRAAGSPGQSGQLDAQPVSNPYMASSGGPRERAVAALVNGPAASTDPGAVRSLDSLAPPGPGGVRHLSYYPVSNGKVETDDPNNPPPVDDQKCNVQAPADPGGLACANDPNAVGDDADDEGHEAQPITVDFAHTIGALMGLQFSRSDQLQGRVLQEAFLNKLKVPGPEEEDPLPPGCSDVAQFTMAGSPVTVQFNCQDETGAALTYRIVSGPAHGTLGPIVNDTVTYTPASGFSGIDSFTYQAASEHGTSEVVTAFVTVAEPPVVVRGPSFDFYGLVQKVKARVVDSRDRTWARAPRRSVLSTIRLEGDFGKEEAAVTLTFYRASPSRSRRKGRTRRSRAVRLKPIARFDPFVVKRGHVTMRLKVPPLFKPHYVGLTVREIARTASGARVKRGGQACTTLKTRKRVPFRCAGPSRGVIVRIADAHRLHKRKPGQASPRRRR